MSSGSETHGLCASQYHLVIIRINLESLSDQICLIALETLIPKIISYTGELGALTKSQVVLIL
jgi:hypothetical protein